MTSYTSISQNIVAQEVCYFWSIAPCHANSTSSPCGQLSETALPKGPAMRQSRYDATKLMPSDPANQISTGNDGPHALDFKFWIISGQIENLKFPLLASRIQPCKKQNAGALSLRNALDTTCRRSNNDLSGRVEHAVMPKGKRLILRDAVTHLKYGERTSVL